MIGPVNSYSSIYVAACGKDFPSHKEGVEHEKGCIFCRGEINKIREICNKIRKVSNQ